ncbi:MAG: hypothetical protein MR832_03385 [Clostridiales bacterium]|nr:hypothetical protein [Clostridiales bacterium]
MSESFAVSGIHVGEHSFVPEKLTEEFEARGVGALSFLTIRTRETQVEPVYFYEWARWCAAHRVYFMFLYTMQHAPAGKESQFTPEVVAKIREIAGPYFLGDQIGETGTEYGARPRGYGAKMPEGMEDMQSCRDFYVRALGRLVETDRKLGMPYIAPVEATALIRYTFDAGCTLALLEMMPGDPEFLVSLTRGCSYAYGRPLWGTYIAQEWYGGLRHDDFLKRQRMKTAYRYAYLAGSHIVCLESGDEKIESFGSVYENDHPLCREYRDEVAACEARFREHPRLAESPETRVAFVYGNLEAYTGWQGTSVWEQYDRDEWSAGPAEWSWRILEDLRHGRSWQEVENYGESDLSPAPAYGLYDVIPADTPREKLARYEKVIFVGWNTMTPEIWDNLRGYVSDGGHLFLTAAHLNTNTRRDGRYLPIFDGKTAEFLGCDVTGTVRVNAGVKFLAESLCEGVRYPVIPNGTCDPIMAGGVFHAAELALSGAQTAAVWHDDFRCPTGGERPAVTEHAYGRGVVTFQATADYPGAAAVYPLYRTVVRELVTASHRRCPIRVTAGDKLRFAVYRGEREDQICLLNTDFSNPVTVKLEAYGKTAVRTLAPAELAWETAVRQ